MYIAANLGSKEGLEMLVCCVNILFSNKEDVLHGMELAVTV
jgi:hypothetical protein